MVGLSHLAGSGLLLVLALLPLTLDGKPALPPQALHKAPVAPTAPAAPTAPLRIMRDLRPDSKQSRADWDQMVQPEPHAGGARDSSRLQQQDNKGGTNGCFGRRLDRISHTTDMGCRRLTAAPKLPSALQNMQDLHAGKKQSQAA